MQKTGLLGSSLRGLTQHLWQSEASRLRNVES